MNSVFDSKPTRIGPIIGSEKIHEFFARQGRPEVVPIRDWIERWYDQLPADKRADIRGRLRSSLHEFTTACFELQMFAMLKNLGYEVTVWRSSHRVTHLPPTPAFSVTALPEEDARTGRALQP